MRQELIDVFSDQPNAAIVRAPGRAFPGVVIQGDSLDALCRMAREALAAEDARKELLELLEGLRRHYEETLAVHGVNLPYSKA